MRIIEEILNGVVLLEPQLFEDERGWFHESYSQKKLAVLGIESVFVQDNRSFSEKAGTLRGLHCQREPVAQAKMFTCTRGAIWDVAIDIRKNSPSYLQWKSFDLTEENKRMLFIPKGFLHGFVTLSDKTEVFYKTDNFYSSNHDVSVKFDDKLFKINWPGKNYILSEKDKNAKPFNESDLNFYSSLT